MKTSNKILTSGLAIILTLILASIIYVRKEIRVNSKSLSSEMASIETNLEKFNSIDIIGNYNIIIKKGESYIKIQGNKSLVEEVNYRVEGSKLILEPKKEINTINFNGNQDIDIYLSTLDLEHINLTGNGEIEFVSTYQPVEAEIEMIGNGTIDARFETKLIQIQCTGNGEIKNTGKSENLSVEMLGNGLINLYESPSSNGDVKMTGNGNIQVHCNSKLNATLLGNGSIEYRGDAQVTKNNVGNGSIEKDE